MEDATVFSEDPAAMARHWMEQGRAPPASGRPERRLCRQAEERSAIKAILREVGDEIPVQLGGGIRDLDTIERYLDDGVSYVIIGTAAVKNPGFLHDACGAFPATSSSASMPRTARWPPMAGAR
jgi:phosphoribosylformimino-5-aminoimidazole carboxamide ribotide isomerase